MATSQNGWPVIEGNVSPLYTWTIPTKSGIVKIRLRNGSAGFLLCLFVMWYSNHIEPVYQKLLDDWGWAYRPIRGQSSGFSNHASGTAVDVNATKHPLGRVGTLSFNVRGKLAIVRINWKLKNWFLGSIRAGADYQGRKDEMHYEINVSLPVAEKRARALMKTKAGKKLLAANPSQKAVILS